MGKKLLLILILSGTCIVLMLTIIALIQARKLVFGAGRQVQYILKDFSQEKITSTFISSIPEIFRTPGGMLEVAALESTEVFSKATTKKIFWDKISLGTTYTEIKVPVTYRYQLRLNDAWRVEVRDGLCTVFAPKISPVLPPAIHTDKIEKLSINGWARFDAQEQMDALEKSITPILSEYATDSKRLNLILPVARKTVEEFIRNWLIEKNQWGRGKYTNVVVLFENEPKQTPKNVTGVEVF